MPVPNLTYETITETLVHHLLNGGVKSVTRKDGLSDALNFNCKYRGDDGAKCFVGLFLTDGEVDESWAASYYFDNYVGLPGADIKMSTLQNIHDSSTSWNLNGKFTRRGWFRLRLWAESVKVEWRDEWPSP